jgi:hypothetical protein
MKHLRRILAEEGLLRTAGPHGRQKIQLWQDWRDGKELSIQPRSPWHPVRIKITWMPDGGWPFPTVDGQTVFPGKGEFVTSFIDSHPDLGFLPALPNRYPLTLGRASDDDWENAMRRAVTHARKKLRGQELYEWMLSKVRSRSNPKFDDFA